MYYCYTRRPIRTRTWLIILTVIAVAVFVTSMVLTYKTYSGKIQALEVKIEKMSQKETYYKEVEEQWAQTKAQGIVLQKYEDKLIQKDAKINTLVSKNQEQSKQAAALENTIKKFAYATGERPQNYIIPKTVSRGSYDRYEKTYVGVWLGTYYAPNPKECGNNKGITASGRPVEPGKTIAVDPKYWKLGTRFYIEGIGEVLATDTGSAIKGRERFDYCVFDTKLSGAGNFKAKVWVIKP